VVAFACLYFFWGSTFTAIRIGAQTMPALLMGGTRYILSGSLMLVWCWWRGYKLMAPRREMAITALIGLLLLGGGNMGLIYAERVVPSVLASLLYAGTPLYAALAERFLPGGEPIARRGWAGLLLGFAGLCAMLAPSLRMGLKGNLELIISLAALIGGTFSWAAGSLVSRHTRLGMNIFVAAAWQMLIAGVTAEFVGIAAGEWPEFHPNAAGWGAVAYLVVAGSWIGYTAFIYLLEHVPVAKVMSYTYVNPVVAVLLGMVLLNEHLVASEYVGMAAIIVAVFLLTTAKVEARIEEPAA
jgi:drug/metabolite transporter (DMT)-like permease